ncbi:MAG: flagellar biosynthesis protein FlhB [Alphaproteobacteria bacterium]|nr:flagellar biosynthesis protein FlhB [Alphaproteobacteria bacterium]
MSDEPDKSEKTEDPSQRKLEEARRKGDVAKSQELTTWFMMLGSTLLFAIMAPVSSAALVNELVQLMNNAGDIDLEGGGFTLFINNFALGMLGVALLPLVFLAFFAIAGNLVQHAPLLSIEPIKPKFSRISPIAGAKRMFSSEALFNFVKGLMKITVVSVALLVVIWPEMSRLDTLITGDLAMLMPVFLELALKVFGVAIAIVTVIAGADFAYQRWKWWERQKMTVKEVKDEYKQMEGDPHVKQRIRQIRNEKARQRMMQAVPEATVVITNPTHYAVALKYERGMRAPVCVAKGADRIALRIREIAGEADVPIVENPPLARALYASVDNDQSIPVEHFKAVAEVVGYVMRLKQKHRWRA